MQVEVIKSRRKTISIEIRPDLRVVVRAPYRMSKRDINAFVTEKQDWIEKHMKIVQERNAKQQEQIGRAHV